MTSMFILVTRNSNTLHEMSLLMEALFNKNAPQKHATVVIHILPDDVLAQTSDLCF